MIDLHTRVLIPKSVLARRVGDEVIVLDMERGEYFGLPAVGARIWELLPDGKSLADVADVVASEYDVDRAAAERDVLGLVADLSDKGLLVIAPACTAYCAINPLQGG